MELLFLGTGAGDFQALDDAANESPHVVAARRGGGRNLRYAAASLVVPDLLIDCHDTIRRTHLFSCRFSTFANPRTSASANARASSAVTVWPWGGM